VAADHLDYHHVVPRSFFESEAVVDAPVNTVTVHSIKCPGHHHHLSHQALDQDIEQASETTESNPTPARVFNLVHMTNVLHKLGEEMAPRTRKRVINTIYRMHFQPA
jgi:hypothetical protein